MRRQLHIVLFGMLLFFCTSPKSFAAEPAEKPKTAALPNKEGIVEKSSHIGSTKEIEKIAEKNGKVELPKKESTADNAKPNSSKDSTSVLTSSKASPSPTPNTATTPTVSRTQTQLNSQNFSEMIPGSIDKGKLSAESTPEPDHAITQDLGTDSLSKEIALRKKMLEWSRQLGVTCNYCHNTNNFKSDEMATFKAAQKHKGTVRLLNEEVFTERDKGGALKVVADCYMCHRGKNKPEFKEPAQNLMK